MLFDLCKKEKELRREAGQRQIRIYEIIKEQSKLLKELKEIGEQWDAARFGAALGKQSERLDALTAEAEVLSVRLKEMEVVSKPDKELRKQLDQVLEKLKGIEKVIHRRNDRLEMCMVHFIPRAELSFEIALAEHCNLNCKGCDHFSPLAEPEFADVEETAKDFARIGELFHTHVSEVHLLGGEPLLHPELLPILRAARKSFPTAVIDITTNALKLLEQPEAFWLACRDNRIVIRPTKYPIPLDFTEIERRAAQYSVDYRYIGSTGSVTKTSNRYVLDPEGRQDGNRNFILCHRANTCVYLAHGRLYTCTIPPTVRHFNRFFGTDMRVSPEDSIDIYQAVSAKDIMDFLARPIPFCKYCMADKTIKGIPWGPSRKEIKEWTL